jgi:endoglucanase
MPYYGFNFPWMLVGGGARPKPTDERALDFLAANGFDFVRIPTNYRVWTTGFEYLRPEESVFDAIDGYLGACRSKPNAERR